MLLTSIISKQFNAVDAWAANWGLLKYVHFGDEVRWAFSLKRCSRKRWQQELPWCLRLGRLAARLSCVPKPHRERWFSGTSASCSTHTMVAASASWKACTSTDGLEGVKIIWELGRIFAQARSGPQTGQTYRNFAGFLFVLPKAKITKGMIS